MGKRSIKPWIVIPVEIGTAAILLTLWALILTNTGNLSQPLTEAAATTAGAGVTLAGGVILSASRKKQALLNGLLAAFPLMIAGAVGRMLIGEGIQPSGLWKVLALLLAGLIGGIIGMRRKKVHLV